VLVQVTLRQPYAAVGKIAASGRTPHMMKRVCETRRSGTHCKIYYSEVTRVNGR